MHCGSPGQHVRNGRVKRIRAHKGLAVMAPTPVLPKAATVGPLSADIVEKAVKYSL
jgi:hypothetical protein